MLWQRGLPPIPAVQAKLKKAGSELGVQKLNLEEWCSTVAKKTAPRTGPIDIARALRQVRDRVLVDFTNNPHGGAAIYKRALPTM